MRDNAFAELDIQEKGKSLGLRLKQDDLAALHQRFKMDGYSSLSDLVRSYLDGQLMKAGRTDQAERLLARLREKNITDPLTGDVTPTFYKNIDQFL